MSEVEDAIAQAYACDRAGDEHAAIRHYDRAWQLGVPEPARRRFLVGYGSTLRNVGRADDAVAILAEAIQADPDYAPLQAFLALALFSAGQPRAALATMLGLTLDLAGDRLDGYDRALTEYHHELLTAALR